MPDPTAKYPGVSATMDAALSEYLLWELSPLYCRQELTASAAVKPGDIVASGGVYGMAIAPAANGESVVCVVRCAVFDGSHGTITSAAKAALEAQGIVVKDFAAPTSDTAATVSASLGALDTRVAAVEAAIGSWTAATPARTTTVKAAIEACETAIAQA